ncbi:MAG: 50S ribosomal protein L25/general stress protein Ctc [Sphingomonas sp.]|jgi:large subunit ribosomal protein L25|uniref:50S ribosomal protein L25/general stress protein Ctc n=1 Tax=Sphingomonas sp. CD22 TaxID=3100214 RepID=UPI00120E3DCB|nr:50S ribosomal protein L25/general stress protein Ctc [Sphingomonas sp. CD22]MEA1085737.1 50S ribosomal protein L25/general stress protein Ctc [Sphingomonas sp. CD22]RZL56534.1 MAG: 50S ribosomal protein L25/general stress protein Ctc [Sphingomonas sp.]
MSDSITLAAETRDRVGKGASRALRRDGRVPAVIYGQNKEPTSIHLEEKALMKALMTGHFMTSVIMIDGQRTLPKDVTFHPVTDRPIHVDFLRIGEHTEVTVAVPIVFTDEDDAPGIKRGNGVLNITRHEIELVVDAADIPSEITISLKGLEIGDSIHISDVKLPKGATPAIDDRDFAIATIVPPTVPTAQDEALDAEVAETQAAEAAAEAEPNDDDNDDDKITTQKN